LSIVLVQLMYVVYLAEDLHPHLEPTLDTS